MYVLAPAPRMFSAPDRSVSPERTWVVRDMKAQGPEMPYPLVETVLVARRWLHLLHRLPRVVDAWVPVPCGAQCIPTLFLSNVGRVWRHLHRDTNK